MRASVSPASDSTAPVDDLGTPVVLPFVVRRVVSLVPSLTEAIAATDPDLLVGATDWCTHPAGLDVPRVGGTRWPDLDRVRALSPDLVVANAEENPLPGIEELRRDGVAVWVTAPTTLPAALVSLRRMLSACGTAGPDWLRAAEHTWSEPYDGARRRAVIFIWRKPWMAIGRDTFSGDVLGRLGVDNVLAGSLERYPKVALEQVRALRPDLVVLPDEPYAFAASDGPEAFADWGVPVALVSGRHLTWYGPSLVEARDLLASQLSGLENQTGTGIH